MAQRFTSTSKWEDPWFMELPIQAKLAWQFLCDRCDNAGVIDVSQRLLDIHIGGITKAEILDMMNGRVAVLPSGKWHVVKFVEFQYPAGLSESSAPHRSVMRLLDAYGLPLPHRKSRVDGRVGTALHGSAIEQTRPDTEQTSGSKGGTGGRTSERLMTRGEFVIGLQRLRVSTKVADGEDHVEEWWGFAQDCGCQSYNEALSCIGSIVRRAKKNTEEKIRYASQVESYKAGYLDWRAKQQAEKVAG